MSGPTKKSRTWPRPRSKPAFYFDENIPLHLAGFLRSKGYNVETAHPSRLGLSDVAQLGYATTRGRLFLTFDSDPRQHRFPARRILESEGVVIISSDNQSAAHYQQLLLKLLKYLEGTSLAGKLCLVSDAGVRLKPVVE